MNEETTQKKELSTEEKIEALIRAFGELEEEVKQLRHALVNHTTDGSGKACLPLGFILQQ